MQLVQRDPVRLRVGHGNIPYIVEGLRVLAVVAGVREQEHRQVQAALRGEHQQGGGLHPAAV
jgi:hypothetical protein